MLFRLEFEHQVTTLQYSITHDFEDFHWIEPIALHGKGPEKKNNDINAGLLLPVCTIPAHHWSKTIPPRLWFNFRACDSISEAEIQFIHILNIVSLTYDALPAVRTTIRNCYFHLRQLRLVRHSLSKEAAHALVRAMIHCRLDYCNSVLANQPLYVYSNLQSVLRTAARLVMRLPGYASVTEVMRKDLHWLGFPQRISYKLCTLTYKCLHGMAPEYLTRCFTPVSSVDGHSHLRSAAAGHLVVPTTKTKTIGTKSFHYSAPVIWNSLPLQLRDWSLTYENFKRLLKTCLF